MNRRTGAVLAAGAGAVALWVAWGLYATRSAERVPSETVERFDGVELRRYPETVVAETTAPDERTAFERLYRYITGANDGSASLAMTAPVATRETGATIPMTAPVRTRSGDSGTEDVARDDSTTGTEDSTPGMEDSTAATEDSTTETTAPLRTGEHEDGVTMGFYLPASYDPEEAPLPTDPTVRLVVEPPRTVAVRSFSWFATDRRVERQGAALLDALDRRGVEPRGDPSLLRYDPPWTPPFLRTNEVAVEVEAAPGE